MCVCMSVLKTSNEPARRQWEVLQVSNSWTDYWSCLLLIISDFRCVVVYSPPERALLHCAATGESRMEDNIEVLLQNHTPGYKNSRHLTMAIGAVFTGVYGMWAMFCLPGFLRVPLRLKVCSHSTHSIQPQLQPRHVSAKAWLMDLTCNMSVGFYILHPMGLKVNASPC